MLRSALFAAVAVVASASSCRELKSAFRSSECCSASLDTDTEFAVKNISKRVLLVIDTQYCFLNTSSTLPVTDAYKIIPVLNQLRDDPYNFFELHIRSQDFHPTDHISFGPTFGLYGFYNYPYGLPMMCTEDSFPDSCCPKLHSSFCPVAGSCPTYDEDLIASNPACSICFPEGPNSTVVNASCTEINQAMWPIHCMSPFEGGDAGFPIELDDRPDDIVLRKGQSKYMDAYSVFQDNAAFHVGTGLEAGFDFNLHERLSAAGIEEVYVAGLAYDFCVAWSAKDAASLGYSVTVIEDATAAISDSTADAETEAMLGMNISITASLETRRRRMSEKRRRMKQEEKAMMRKAGVKFAQSADILKQMRESKVQMPPKKK